MTVPLGIRGFRQVAQRAVDLDRAVRWYATLLDAEPIAVFDPPGLAFFDVGGVRLLLDRGAPAGLLYLDLPDVEVAVERLRGDGVRIDTEPHVVFADAEGRLGPPGEDEVLAFVRDSEDNLLGLLGRRPTA